MSVNGWIDKEDVVYIHIYNGILSDHEKEGSPAICYNMDGPGGCYANSNKLDWERQIVNNITYMWNFKKTNSEKQGVEWWLPKVGGGGKGEMLLKGYKLPVLKWTSSGI